MVPRVALVTLSDMSCCLIIFMVGLAFCLSVVVRIGVQEEWVGKWVTSGHRRCRTVVILGAFWGGLKGGCSWSLCFSSAYDGTGRCTSTGLIVGLVFESFLLLEIPTHLRFKSIITRL